MFYFPSFSAATLPQFMLPYKLPENGPLKITVAVLAAKYHRSDSF